MVKNAIILKNIYLYVLLACLRPLAECASFKIGNPVNNNLQTGEVVLLSSSLALNSTTYYTIVFPNAMSTNILETALGIAGSTFIIERQQGWSMYVTQVNQTQLTVELWSYYDIFTPSSTLSHLRTRYLVSCHPYVEIDYVAYTFGKNDNVTDPNTYDEGCQYIRCRKKALTITYAVPKAIALTISGVPFLAGYAITNLPQNGELMIPTSVNWGTTWTFSNYTQDNYYGITVSVGSYTTTTCQLTVTVYGLISLSKIHVYFMTYESTLTNTYKTKVVSGSSTIGCYYDAGGCIFPPKIKVNSNSTISSAGTSIFTFFNNMYFYGLNHFIIYHEYNDTDFSNSTTYMDPSIKMSFDATSTILNNDVYKTTFSFSGNSNNMFTFKFGYLIDLNFDCPSSGDIYHISSTQCANACPSSFYFDANNYCWKCSSQCFQCTGPTNNDCLSCYTTTHHRVLNGTSCSCQPLYYYQNLINDICPSCSYTCLSCYAADVSNCLTCNATDNRYHDGANSCPCIPGYYDNGGRTCVVCHLTCATCTAGNSNNCLTCPSLTTTFRNITSNQCNCIAGYIHTGTVICSKCHYSCKTCQTTQTNCSACEPTFQRTISTVTVSNVTTSTCPCNSGFYDDGSSSACQPCFVTCKNCNGPTATDCTTCRATDPRALNSPTGQCLCMTGFYDFNNTCIACHYTCLNCTSNTVTTCFACDAAKFRSYNSTAKTCPCNSGYFDPFTTPISTPTCQLCDSKCATCELTLTRCLSCRATDFRELVSNACPCIFGYVDVAGICTICHYSCDSCSGPLASDCLTCNMTARFQSSTSCLCRPGTYDDGMQELCLSCHVQCVECTAGTNDSCTVCDAAMKRVIPATTPNFCYCMSHYYDSGPAACSTCFSQCDTCQYNSTYCLTCNASQFRVINSSHKCQCSPHYYDTGADICLTCASQCYECAVLSTNCISCPVLRTLVNNTCPCVSNYYNDPITGNCLQCGILCQLCQASASQCTQCYSNMNRYLNNTQCTCEFGFYDDGVNPICQTCPYSCQNCSSATVCLECSLTSHRFLSLGQCKCLPGYYDNGVSLVCLTCSPVCQECSDYAVCTVCDSSLHRQLVLGSCVCFGKFYDAYSLATPTTMCAPCHYSCATCSAGTSSTCITCEANRNFTSYSCPCSDGYYESMQICYLCDPLCRTCQGLPTNCTSCFSGLPLIGGTCVCYSHQFMSGTLCYNCDPKCKECLGVGTFCTECYASHLTNLTGNDCTCQAGTFKDSSTLVCTPCHSECLQCTGPSSNECTACDPSSNRILSISQCICASNYYLNSANDTCLLCHSSCSVCSGASNYNCSACQPNFVLIGSYCKPLITCPNYQYEGQCIDVCPKNSYPTALHTCEKCINGCLYCHSDTLCLECQPGYIFNSLTHSCLAICPSGKYISPNGSCLPCFTNCLECQWNSPKNTVTCLKCAALFYLKDGECSSTCSIPYYQPVGSLCLKCIGNCLTCASLSPSACILCKDGTSFLSGQCYATCPTGYFKLQIGSTQPTCELCSFECASCISGSCLSCTVGFHLSNGKCVENGFFFDPNNNATIRCHPNCVSCTNTSFSSCVTCRPYRGDKSELAISGYCECHSESIDMGNGVCDFGKYAEMLKLTQTLVSFSSSAFYLATLTSIVSTNFVGLLGMLGYMQSYSNFYYLNASYVMSVDYVLKEYRKTNVNSFFRSQAEPAQRRALVELQNDKSLFLRDQPYMYLIEWALIPALVISIAWLLSFILYCFQRGYLAEKQRIKAEKLNNKITNETNETFRQQNEYFEQVSNHNPVLHSLQDQKNKIENKNSIGVQKINVGEYIHIFYKNYHESVMIVLQFLLATQIALYAIASFKILAGSNEDIEVGKLLLSILLFGYTLVYNVRLLIGCYRFAKRKHTVPTGFRLSNSLKLLLHFHLPDKNSSLNAVYVPALLLRNQLMSISIVVFSSNSSFQILSCGVILVLFTFYSLIFCPYSTMIKIGLHITELIFIIQLLFIFLTTSFQYGSLYSLNISSTDGSLYRYAWALLSLNYLQIVVFSILAFLILFNLSKSKFCRGKQISKIHAEENNLTSSLEARRKQMKLLQESSQALQPHLSNQEMYEEKKEHQKEVEKIEKVYYPLLKRQIHQKDDDVIIEKVVTKKYRIVGHHHRNLQQIDRKANGSQVQNGHFSVSLNRIAHQQRNNLANQQNQGNVSRSTPLKNILQESL